MWLLRSNIFLILLLSKSQLLYTFLAPISSFTVFLLRYIKSKCTLSWLFICKYKCPLFQKKSSKVTKNIHLYPKKVGFYSVKVQFKKIKIWGYECFSKAQKGVLKLVFIKSQVKSWNCSHNLQKERFENSMGAAIFGVGLQK